APAVPVGLLEAPEDSVERGAVHERVDRPEAIDRGGRESRALLGVGDVGHLPRHPRPGRVDLDGCLLEVRLRARTDGDVGALARGRGRDLPAETGADPG